MTFSICARIDGRHGVAVATKAISVGSTAPFVCRNGAVCTQAMTNTPLGVRTTRLLDDGTAIDAAVNSLLENDPHASLRQVHGVDSRGGAVAVTGDDCVGWAGHRESTEYTVAGNMLAERSVLEAVADGFEATAGRSLDARLLASLRAGEDAGGDDRSDHAQSAALKLYDPVEPRLEHDLRVDEHDDAVGELERIYDEATTLGAEWAERYPEADLQRHPK